MSCNIDSPITNATILQRINMKNNKFLKIVKDITLPTAVFYAGTAVYNAVSDKADFFAQLASKNVVESTLTFAAFMVLGQILMHMPDTVTSDVEKKRKLSM